MFDTVLFRIREKIRLSEYVMTLHAQEEMENDELTIFDIELSQGISSNVRKIKIHQNGNIGLEEISIRAMRLKSSQN